jgi:hypothetical protein
MYQHTWHHISEKELIFIVTVMRTSILTVLYHYAANRKAPGSIANEVITVFNLPNPSSRTMALGSNQHLTEMNTSYLPAGKGRPAHKADDLTATCGSTV